MAWVPPYPPTKGLTVTISHPTENDGDGVVRYRVMCRFDPHTTAYDEPVPNAPISDSELVRRIVLACNDVLVIRRFSEFDNVFKTLSQTKTVPPLPPLPEKKIFGAKDPKFVEDRRAAIETFTRAVLLHPALYRKPEFLHLIGFSSLQLWFALSGPDDEAPTDATLRAVFDVDSETLRSDVIQKAATAKSDAVRRSTGRLMHYAMRSQAGVLAFVYENTRVALTTVANKAEHDSTRYWIATAVRDFAGASDAARQLVGRGDVRDSLLYVANVAQTQQTLQACVQAIEALLQHGTQGTKHLFVTEKVRQLLARAIASFSELEDMMRCVGIVTVLVSLIPEIPRCPPGLFAEPDIHGALGRARDVALAKGDAGAHDTVLRCLATCRAEVTVAATPAIAMPRSLPVWAVAQSVAAVPASSSSKAAADDFLADDDFDVPASAAPVAAVVAPSKKAAVDDFLSEDDDDVTPAAKPQAAAPTPSVQPAAAKTSALDDFLDD